MKLPIFFIDRPVFATIINIVIVIVGLLCLKTINLREYPDVTSPELSIKISYPNASPEIVESEITFIAENELAGINGLETIKSTSSYEQAKIVLKFSEKINFSKALSDVREKVAVIRSKLPKDIKEPQIYENNANDEAFYYISIINPEMKPKEITHFAATHLKNNLISIPGVASAQIWGEEYAMHITLDRSKLYLYKVNVSDILDKLKIYNANLPAGRINDLIPITIDLASHSPEDFAEIVIKSNNSGNVKLKDIAKVDLSKEKNFRVRIGGKPGIIIAVTKTINSNPLEVSELLTKKLEQIRQTLPAGYIITTESDKSDFIRTSLSNVKKSIIEAIILVVFIIFIFLRNIRAALIPLITIPICLAGSIAVLNIFGFSLNTLTLLAMVLSIGLVVDDAIVILENIYKHLEKGKTPLQAAKDGSREIGFAVVAMTFTLTSVFIPIAFVEGGIGKLFIEFAVALAGSVIISGIVALTLSPMLAAKILKPNNHNFLPKVDAIINQVESIYQTLLLKLLPKKLALFIGMVLIILSSISIYYFLPKEMAPKEDRGIIGIYIPQMANISLDQLDDYGILIEKAIQDTPEIDKMLSFTFSGGGEFIAKLKNWSNRNRSSEEVREEFQQKVKAVPSVQAFAWSWDNNLPGIELDTHGGLDFIVKTTFGYQELLNNLEKIVYDLKKNPLFKDASHNLELNNLGYDLKFNKHKLSQLEILPNNVSDLLAISFGDKNIQTFLKDGLPYDVNISSSYKPKGINEIYIFNNKQQAISISSFADLEMKAKAKELKHYDQMRSAKVNMKLNSNVKFSDAFSEIGKFIKNNNLPGITIDLSNNLKKFQNTYSQMLFLILLSVFFIYAVLAIQFESFIDPLIIIFTVPFGCLGALLFTKLSGNSINIFSQIGVITLIGLISKHGIMIVEFANHIVKNEGKSYYDAAIKASKLRLRPILMTTFAMIFGSLPLVFSLGAGAEARSVIGYVLVGGLILGTLFTIFLIPFTYIVLKKFSPKN